MFQYVYGFCTFCNRFSTFMVHIDICKYHTYEQYTLVLMKNTICSIQNLCYLDAEQNSKVNVFLLISLSLSTYLQFSLPGITLEMMIFNSTYFSSPFDNSSLFTFPAHLNQEYLQIFFFQLSISKAKSLLKREKRILKQHDP